MRYSGLMKNPLRYFDSSPEVVRLVAHKYVHPNSLPTKGSVSPSCRLPPAALALAYEEPLPLL